MIPIQEEGFYKLNQKSQIYKTFSQRIPLGYASSIVLVSAFLIGGIFIAKYFMLKNSDSYSGFLDVLRVSNRDLIVILVLAFILIILPVLYHRKATLLVKLRIPYAVLAMFYLLSVIAQAILFKTTGFGLTREYLQNFFQNPGEDIKMVLTEIRFAWWLALLAILIFLICLTRIAGSVRLRRLAQRLSGGSSDKVRTITIILILGFLISLECLALLSPLESVHPAIKQVALFELVHGLLPENDDQEDVSFVISPEDRLDQPVILEPGERFKPLNVVLIIFESLSWKYCDVYRPGLGATPFLEELSKESKIVERLYSVDPHTTKALVTIIAGIYPYPEPGVMEARPGILPEKALPHLLRRFGYQTAFFQTANNYEDRQELVANLGYQVFRGLYHMPQEGFAYVNYFGREEMMMLKPSLEWVDRINNEPFFLTYLTLSTHHEYGYPPGFPARNFGVSDERQNRYLNAVRYTDYFIRKLFEEFQKRNLIERTIFIIVGDHGEAFGEHGLEGHNFSLWEEGMRVPGLIYAPGLIKEAGKIDGFRSVLDVAPTVCDLLGLKIKNGSFLGRSLLSPADESREFFYTGWSKSRVIACRRGRYKYVFPSWKPQIEIYDNLTDENDEHNLYDLRKDLAAEAEAWRNKCRVWFDSVAFQYRQWAKAAQSEHKSFQPEEFDGKLEVVFDNLIKVYGYGYFPEKTEPGRAIYLRLGIKCENRVKRPLQLRAVLSNEETGLTYNAYLDLRIPMESLQPGQYSSAECIIHVPKDWPVGLNKLYIGLLDEKRQQFLKPMGSGLRAREDGTVYLCDVNVIHPTEIIN